LIETFSRQQAERRINFEIINIKGEKKQPEFRCNSTYLIEMISRTKQNGNLVISFDDKPEDTEERSKPITVAFPENINEVKKTKEHFHIFFATSNR